MTGDLTAAVAESIPDKTNGLRPSMEYSATGGTITGRYPETGDADPAFWRLVISDWGLDPDVTEIVPDSVRIRSWDQAIGKGLTQRARWYEARIRPKRAAMCAEDVAELSKLAMRRKPTKPASHTYRRGVGYVLNLSDFQIGKGEGGGTPATVERITTALHQSVDRVKALRKTGREISTINLVGMGDLAEQCMGHYPSQLFTTDCTRREQLQIVRELILLAINLHCDLAPEINVGAVPGNHGENRANGKMVTTIADNDDLAVFDQVRDACRQNTRFDHVTFNISDNLVLTMNVEGVEVAWTHMHQGPGSGEKRIADWWRGQVMGNRPISNAQILNTAHYHHLLLSESTGRTIIQVPAMDGGSGWWTDKTGNASPAGMVSYLAGTGCGTRGWSDLQILEGK